MKKTVYQIGEGIANGKFDKGFICKIYENSYDSTQRTNSLIKKQTGGPE